MKQVIPISFFVCFSLISSAQDGYINYLNSIKPDTTSVYNLIGSLPSPVIIRMPFNGSRILNPKALAGLKDMTITRIDLVYTHFRESKTFNQPKLNKDRLDSLKKYAPQLFASAFIEWHFIAQLSARTVDSASNMFHGFVIYPKAAFSAESAKAELDMITHVMDSIETLVASTDSQCIVTTFKTKRKYQLTGFFVARSKLLAKKGIKSTVRNWRFPYVDKELLIDTIYKSDTLRCRNGEIDYSVVSLLPDSTILNVLERHPEWKEKLVVTDVTGSMAPYTVQLLVWYRMKDRNADVSRFAFFNDGDKTPDNRKAIGRTGGIYFSEGKKGFDIMKKTMLETMTEGTGGDVPENNIEALLKGIQNCPECNELVMIADNWAPVKDMILLSKVTKPVRIILCGVVNDAFNSDYLEIARATGGSVHTLDRDLNDLMKVNEGERITIGSKEFVIRNGKFVLVRGS